ncbi:MAG: protein nirF [Deltaproteobacteria bacterium]|nr:MAG: protein nirF [Deltaproteobacteria bacterium]
MKRYLYLCIQIIMITLIHSPAIGSERWGTGALMVVVERESSSVVVVDSLKHEILGRIADLGLLHHATVSFSHDARYAFLVSRDGWLNKLDLLTLKRVAQVRVGDSAIGLAVTQDNRFVAVSNYKPPVVKIVDAETLALVHTISADKEAEGKKVTSRTVGMVDAPGNLLIFSLMDADGIWIVDANKNDFPVVKKFWDIGRMPYDALLTPDGRYYIAGLYHSPHLAMLDTWKLDQIKKISLNDPLKKTPKMGVRKVPHLEGWAMGNSLLFTPVVGEERLTVYKFGDWELIKSVPLAGIPMFAMSGPDGRHIWVNFSGANNRFIQVIDALTLEVVKTLEIGDKVFHMGFTPKGKNIYISSYKENKVVVLDTRSFQKIKEIPVCNPSGIFSSVRAHIIGL